MPAFARFWPAFALQKLFIPQIATAFLQGFSEAVGRQSRGRQQGPPMGDAINVLQAKVESLSQQNDRLISGYESLRDGQRLFEQFCRGQLEDQARDLNTRRLVVHGLQPRAKESLQGLKDRITLELGMAALPRFSLSRRLGGGMAVLELAVPDDKHAFFKHQGTPAMRSKRVFFKDFLTVQEQKNTLALGKLHAEVREAGFRPFFRGDVLHWTDASGMRHTQTAEGLGSRSREEQVRRGWGAGGNRGTQERARHTPLVSRPSGQPTNAGPSGPAETRSAAQPTAVAQGGGGRGNGIGKSARKAAKAARQAQGAADTKEADAARREESRRATNEARAEELRVRERAVQEQEESCRAREFAAASQEARLTPRIPQIATRGTKAAAAAASAAALAVAAPGVAVVSESAPALIPGVVTAVRDNGRSEGGSMASAMPAAGGPGATCSLNVEGTTRNQKRSQDQSTLGRIAGAVTGALREVVQDVSEDGIELFRSAAQVLGSPGWQEKQRTAAERPSRDLSCDSPGAERPPKHPARSRLGDRSSTARALFPARQPLQQQPQLTSLPPPPERATLPGAPIIWPSGSPESNRAAAPAPSAMEIGQPN